MKPKLTKPLSQIQNDDGASLDAAEFTSSHMYRNLHTALLSTLFKSDQPPLGLSNYYKSHLPPFGLLNWFRLNLSPDYEKTDEQPVGGFLWQNVCCYIGIKNSLPKQASFCEYTWEVITYMVITSNRYSSPDIWSEISNQGTSTEEMIFTIWYKEAIKHRKINSQQHHLLTFTRKKACYTSYINSN